MRFERSGGFGGRRFGGGRGFGRDSRSGFSDEPKPVKVGEEYDVEITETGSRGDGIARVNNFVVFVNGAKQGEKIKVRITDVRDRFAIGEKSGAKAASAVAEDAAAVAEDASDVTEKEVAVAEDDEGGEGGDSGGEQSGDEPSDEEFSEEEK